MPHSLKTLFASLFIRHMLQIGLSDIENALNVLINY